MASILIQLDEQTLRALDRIAPAAKRQRAEFIRQAIKTALWKAEEERTRRAYLSNPDTETEADDWSNAEKFRI
jgi:metal-responsive CopG/Arc/MetJ family transcriptional regulator